MDKLKIAVFISGGGTNLQSIINQCESGGIDAEISVVFSNKAKAYGLVRAQNHNIPTVVVKSAKCPDRPTHEAEVIKQLEPFDFELICLAGYMRLVTPDFISHYYNHARQLPGIMNIHPALLPSFPGVHGYEDAFHYGVKYSGITIHFVDEGEDTGPIIVQEVFKRQTSDTLEDFRQRGLAVEHRLYPEAIQLYAHRKLEVDGRFVRIKA